jgi:beta-glucanase (GH16 family)
MFRVALFITTLTSATYGWRLRWADEFDGDALNTSLWQAAANWSEAPPRWNQVECYTPSNVAVHDGALWLTARLENTTCGRRDGPTYNITSGKVDSRGRGVSATHRGARAPPKRVGLWIALGRVARRLRVRPDDVRD